MSLKEILFLKKFQLIFFIRKKEYLIKIHIFLITLLNSVYRRHL